ncbi:MAG: phosphoribosyltransferase [Candidatus Diapherotrites archaeon]|nr:phosphoribosyltransferase [Candidatus Diapherotrites archaeon]
MGANEKNIEKKISVSWDEFDLLCRQLVSQIKSDGFSPDVIIAVSRGGLVPAQIISHELKNNELYVIKVEYYKDDIVKNGMKTNKKPVIVQKLNKSIKGKKVLVVDEVSDSGATCIAVKNYIERQKPEQVKFLTVHWKPWSKFRPDYFAKEADGWVVYPWSSR